MQPPRRAALGSLFALGAAAWAGCRREAPAPDAPATTRTARLPVVFVGHGSPMNAVDDTPWSAAWRTLGAALSAKAPRAILCVSAHWFVQGTWVTSNASPRTIHDFGGFPKALYEVRYPARGAPALAQRVSALLAAYQASPREDWGLDHGSWSVLRRLRPDADVPVLQLSIHRGLPASAHLALGRALAPLREEGVLVLGSGNVTHNLPHALSGATEAPAWATRFDADVAKALEQRDAPWLEKALATDDGRAAHPTPDHYLPLLYVVGAATSTDAVSFPVAGFDLGSISMRAVQFG